MRCEACRSYFTGDRARIRFCPHCSSSIARLAEKLESLADLCDSKNEQLRRDSKQNFWGLLNCPTCEWQGNKNRTVHEDMRLNRVYAEGWAIRMVEHQMQHAFPGRFLPSRRRSNLWFYKMWEPTIKKWDKWSDSHKAECEEFAASLRDLKETFRPRCMVHRVKKTGRKRSAQLAPG